jgi:hypothetical protein
MRHVVLEGLNMTVPKGAMWVPAYRALSWARPIQSTPHYPVSPRSILIVSTHLRIGLPRVSFLLAFLPTNYSRYSSPHSCYMPRPSHPPWLHHSTFTERRVQTTKLLVMQFSPPSRHFIPHRSKYSLSNLF